MWIIMCRSVLEQSCILWHKSLTLENIDDFDDFYKVVLKNSYRTYEEALIKLNLSSLSERRENYAENLHSQELEMALFQIY